MAQQVELLATKPEELNYILGNHRVERNKPLCKLSTELYVHTIMCTFHIYPHTEKKNVIKVYKTTAHFWKEVITPWL